MKKILERAGIEDLRIHDLRRTFGSFQAIGGSSLPIIGRVWTQQHGGNLDLCETES